MDRLNFEVSKLPKNPYKLAEFFNIHKDTNVLVIKNINFLNQIFLLYLQNSKTRLFCFKVIPGVIILSHIPLYMKLSETCKSGKNYFVTIKSLTVRNMSIYIVKSGLRTCVFHKYQN